MSSLPPLKLEDTKPEGPIRAYSGTRKKHGKLSDLNRRLVGPAMAAQMEAMDEDYYQDENGKEITNFNDKTHTVFGTINAEGKRIPNDPKLNSDPDTLTGLLNTRFGAGGRPMYPMSVQSGKPKAATPKAATPTATTPADAVRASAAGPAPQMSIGDRMAADIRKSGRMTAHDQTLQDIDFGNQMYNKANPNAPAGSLAAREAALARMRPNVLQGSGLYEYKTNSGGTNLASTSPDAMTPYSGQTNREVAYQKQFGAGGNWVGDNPLTGEVKIGGKNFSSQGAYEHSIDTKGIEDAENEANDYADNAVADGMRLGKLRDSMTAAFDAAKALDLETDDKRRRNRTDTFLDARVKANALGDQSLDPMSSSQYHASDFRHYTKNPEMITEGRGPNVNGLLQQQQSNRQQGVIDSLRSLPQTTQGERQTSNMVNGLLQQQQSGRYQSVIDSLRSPQQSMPYTQMYTQGNSWTPEAGGMYNGQNMSRADSEPEAGGNYGNPELINTWTPQAGGRFNGVNRSRADSEPEGDYGIPELIRSRTRPMLQPSRASLLKAKQNYDTRGYNGQM